MKNLLRQIRAPYVLASTLILVSLIFWLAYNLHITNDYIKRLEVEINKQGDKSLDLNTECVYEVKACNKDLLEMLRAQQRAERLLDSCTLQLDIYEKRFRESKIKQEEVIKDE